MNNILRSRAEAVLSRFFGYKTFRPGQYEIIEAVSSGRDAMVIMPTGGGKSMCYQIPALLASEGCAVVVSPLIALMQNQTDALMANGIPAAAIHSNRNESANYAIYEAARSGRIKLLYISPERLIAEIDRFRSIPVSLFAIDEAHCISQWGHDFRPDYTALSIIKDNFGNTPVVALTATADRLTRNDIVERLKLSDPYYYIGSFDRPNISLRVINNPGKKERMKFIARMAAKYPDDSGVVYCLSRKNAESTTEALAALGLNVVCYHAGMTPQQRDEALNAFLSGTVQIVCATVAFGMGIDKSNIRWVIHCNLPGNIESYYQEVGRAGRDGLPAEAVLFYSYSDIITRHKFTEDSALKTVNLQKLKQMQDYAEASICRRRILLSYFGQEMTTNCNYCDNCTNPRRLFNGTIVAQKALSGIMRTHQQTGINTLIGILRGISRPDIVREGYHNIPTFGCGRDMSQNEWSDYITQLIQLGAIEILYERGGKLTVTPFGMRLLRGCDSIELAVSVPRTANKHTSKDGIQDVSDPTSQLFAELKAVRQKMAKELGIPPYIIMSDATLLEMATRKPVDIGGLLDISGIGVVKLAKYGKPFLGVLRKVSGMAQTHKGDSFEISLYLFKAGFSPEQIAEIKSVKKATVMSQLAEGIDSGVVTEFHRIIPAEVFKAVTALLQADDMQTLREKYQDGEVAVIRAINRAVGKTFNS